MQFYKFEGSLMNSPWPEENVSRRIIREYARTIAMKSDSFNKKPDKKAFVFVSDVSDEAATIGIICDCLFNIDKQIPAFLRAIKFELNDTVLEEVTFNTVHKLLRNAYNNDYINDFDEVLERFNLDKLNTRYDTGIEFGENIIEDVNKNVFYSDVEHILAKDNFVPELDRIYTGNIKKTVLGHPVHYIIQTDDYETGKCMFRLLLQALYANSRLHSRRYVFLDFKPGDNFSMNVYDCLYKSCIGGTVIVRYLSDDETEDAYAACGRETIENLCKIMKKYHNQVLTVFCLPRECTASKNIFYENLGNISFVELKEDFVSVERAEEFLKMIAKETGVRTDNKLFSMLEKDKVYLAPELYELFDKWYNNKLKTVIFPQYENIAAVKKEIVNAAPKGSAYDELMEMIGLSEAKNVINRALDYYKAQKLFADKGMKSERVSMHMIFTGNPGTAKTSVARLFARIMKENALLSKGDLIEVGRGDLVGKYVGWTASIIQKKFREAQGSVLFIDEAYSLVDDRSGSFGDEAINTIVQEMENHRDDVVVIFAGYPDKMKGFLQKNPGLRSRIAFNVPFADYSTEELCDIALLIAKRKGLTLADAACEKLSGIFERVRKENDFGNGRYVRNAIEKARMSQTSRLLKMDFDTVKSSDISTICADDIEMPKFECRQKNKIGFSA